MNGGDNIPKLIDLTGMRFDRLVVVRQGDRHRQPNGKTVIMWECICDCGKTVLVSGCSLRGGRTHSCGCYNKEVAQKTVRDRVTTHGKSNERLYKIWKDMKRRCTSPSYRDYIYYGGRGISICDEWLNDYMAFRQWAYANGYDDSAKRSACTLDRINVNENYTPDNCRWVNMLTQANNKRNVQKYTYSGETHTVPEWSRITGINYFTLFRRLKAGMSIEKALCKGSYSGIDDLRSIRHKAKTA